MNTLTIDLAQTVIHMVPAAAYCLPQDAMNALDTAKLWTTIVAAALSVVALIMIGIGMFFQHSRGDGGQMIRTLGWWIGGAVLVAGASGIATIFVNAASSNCVSR